MFAFLLSVGILVTAAGCFTVGFGIPINGFDLGNTLITAGTTSICAGLVLIGLAACVRELHRISDTLSARPGARPVRGLEAAGDVQPAASPHAAQTPRIPYPAKPAPEPAPIEEPERARPNVFPIPRAAAEHPIVEEPEAVPLAPVRSPAAPLGRTPAPPGEAPYQPKFGPADILARLGSAGRTAGRTDTPRPFPPSERAAERPAERAPEPPPLQERPRGPVFDAARPSTGKPPERSLGPDAIPRVSKPEAPPEQRIEPRERLEPRERPEPRERAEPRERPESRERVEPPVSSEHRDVAPPPRPAPEARTVSILKSGVIDGMAYTLYTDGSIEAQLPQGTMHFASIEELRTHLENNG